MQGLSKTDRSTAGKQGGITHLIYLASLMTHEIGRDFGVAAGTPNFCINADGGMQLTDPVPYLYHDLPSDEQQFWVSRIMKLWCLPADNMQSRSAIA